MKVSAATSPTQRRKSVGGILGEVALTAAALGGLVCIVLVVLAVAFGLTLIMFKTGSMAPTIPAGSLALVHDIPAGEVRVGDVVTLSRPSKLPVTHRVTSVTQVTGETFAITMRGDANESDDVAPYLVERARIVVASTPGLANVVVAISQPFVMAGLSVAAGALVTWAFWPRENRRRKHGPLKATDSSADEVAGERAVSS